MAIAGAPSQERSGMSLSPHTARALPLLAFGTSLSLFFAISYTLCIIGYLAIPGLPVDHAALAIFLPGFKLLSWSTFLLGLVESFAFGWYIAVIFAPLYNFCAARWR